MPVVRRLVNQRAKRSVKSAVSSSRGPKSGVVKTAANAPCARDGATIDKLLTLIQAKPVAAADDTAPATRRRRTEDTGASLRLTRTPHGMCPTHPASDGGLLDRLSNILHAVYVVALTEKAQLGLPIYGNGPAAPAPRADSAHTTPFTLNPTRSTANGDVSTTIMRDAHEPTHIDVQSSEGDRVESTRVSATAPARNHTPVTPIWNVVVNERFCYNVTRYCQFTVGVDDVAKVAAAFPRLLRLRWTDAAPHRHLSGHRVAGTNAISAATVTASALTARAYLMCSRVPSPDEVRKGGLTQSHESHTHDRGPVGGTHTAPHSDRAHEHWLTSVTAYGSYMDQRRREACETDTRAHLESRRELVEVSGAVVEGAAARDTRLDSPKAGTRGSRASSRTTTTTAAARRAAWERTPRGEACEQRRRTGRTEVRTADSAAATAPRSRGHQPRVVATRSQARTSAPQGTHEEGAVDDATLLAQLSHQLRASLSEDKLRSLLAQMRHDASNVDAKEKERVNRLQEMERVITAYEHVHSLLGLKRRSMNAGQLLYAMQHEGHFDDRRSARSQLQFLLQCEATGLSAVSLNYGPAAPTMSGHDATQAGRSERPSAAAAASTQPVANEASTTSVGACRDIMSLSESELQLVLVTLDRSHASMPRFREFVHKTMHT